MTSCKPDKNKVRVATLPVLIGILLGAMQFTRQVQGLTSTAILEANKRTVVFISVPFYNEAKDLRYTRTGTGVVLSQDGVILTCYHLFKPDPGDSVGQPIGSIASRGGPFYNLRFQNQDPQHDLALLQFPDVGLQWQAASYSFRRPEVGTTVLVMGFPSDCGQRGRCDLVTRPGKITGQGTEARLLTDTSLYHGDSGGPAFSEDGRMVAIVAGGEPGEDQINELIPLALAKTHIESVVTPLADGTLPQSSDQASLTAKTLITTELTEAYLATGRLLGFLNDWGRPPSRTTLRVSQGLLTGTSADGLRNVSISVNPGELPTAHFDVAMAQAANLRNEETSAVVRFFSSYEQFRAALVSMNSSPPDFLMALTFVEGYAHEATVRGHDALCALGITPPRMFEQGGFGEPVPPSCAPTPWG